MSVLVSDRLKEANRIIQAFASTKKRLFRNIEDGHVSRFFVEKGNVVFYDAVNKKSQVITSAMPNLSVQRSMVHTGLIKSLSAYIGMDMPVDPFWFGPWSDNFDLWALDPDDYAKLRTEAANSMAVLTDDTGAIPVSKRIAIFASDKLSSAKLQPSTTGDELSFENLKAVMPSVHTAQAEFDEAYESIFNAGGKESVQSLEDAYHRFNAVLRKAFEAICKDTVHINNAKTLEMVFTPRDKLSTYFPCPGHDVASYLDAVIATSSFNRNYHREVLSPNEPAVGMGM